MFLQPGVVGEEDEDNEDEGLMVITTYDDGDEIRSDPALFLLVVFPQVGRTLLLVPWSILPPGTQGVFTSFQLDLSVVARTWRRLKDKISQNKLQMITAAAR